MTESDEGKRVTPSPTFSASIVIPAHNEAGSIRRLLASLLAEAQPGEFEIVVACNGCTDATADVARTFADVTVLDLVEPSKHKALKAGDQAAHSFPRLYVDADVELSTRDVRAVVEALSGEGAVLAASPERILDMGRAGRLVSEYYAVWSRLPQVRSAIFGRGVVGVSRSGFDRIAALPPVMSDDLAMSEAFSPAERAVVRGASVVVRPPSTLPDLLRRRVRVNVGSAQLDRSSGRAEESKTSWPVLAGIVKSEPRLALSMPVFVGVTMAAKVRARRQIRRGDFTTWLRDESSRADVSTPESGAGSTAQASVAPIWDPADAGQVEISVVIVTYNSSDVLDDLLNSLPEAMEGCSWELLAADNDSRDDTIEKLDRADEDIQIVEMGRNAGYAAGINAALARSKPPTVGVLILNPDVRLEPGSVGLLKEALTAQPGVGIVVPHVVGEDGELGFTLRREPNIKRSLGDAVLGTRIAGRLPAWGEVIMSRESYERPTRADWAAGMALLVSRECFDACGEWDESFFLYSEETEFCLRARDRGYALAMEPRARAMHLGGESQVSARLYALVIVNRLRLYARSHSAVAARAFWLVALLREASRALLGREVSRHVVKVLVSPKRMRDAARIAAGGRPSGPGDS